MFNFICKINKKENIKTKEEIINEEIITKKFSDFFLKTFNYSYSDIIIENYEEYNISSKILNYLINSKLKKINDKIKIKKIFFENLGIPQKNKKVVLFKFSKNSLDLDLCEYKLLLGVFIVSKDSNIYFPEIFNNNESNFENYKFFHDINLEDYNKILEKTLYKNNNKPNLKINIIYYYNFNTNKLDKIIHTYTNKIQKYNY